MRSKIIVVFFVLCVFTINVKAEDIQLNDNYTVYYEDVVNTSKDSGYSKSNPIEKNDPHYGWKLGKFAVSGFSSKRKDDAGNWVLLKNVGDEITLYFNLLQDINKLDGNGDLSIHNDGNGYDTEFGIKQTDFGLGTLIVRKIDSTGNKNEPKIYTNYLKGITVGANTKVDIFEEGDYEIALDYELMNDGFLFFNKYYNYRIRFNFSVRNGNCMVFPFDVKTREELKNTSITDNGFYLDLANSKYLDVNIKKEVLKDGADGLVEDTRYNRPAKDMEEFTEEGIYTITVKNQYTNETTIKKIYVGEDKILKAHVQTGRSIDAVKELVNLGATIDNEGNISNIPKEYSYNYDDIKGDKTMPIVVIVIVIVFITIAFIIVKIKQSNKEKKLIREKIKNKKNHVDLEENQKEVSDEDDK